MLGGARAPGLRATPPHPSAHRSVCPAIDVRPRVRTNDPRVTPFLVLPPSGYSQQRSSSCAGGFHPATFAVRSGRCKPPPPPPPPEPLGGRTRRRLVRRLGRVLHPQKFINRGPEHRVPSPWALRRTDARSLPRASRETGPGHLPHLRTGPSHAHVCGDHKCGDWRASGGWHGIATLAGAAGWIGLSTAVGGGGRSDAGCGRPEDGGVGTAKAVTRPPQQPAHPPIRQLPGAADVQTAHPATSSTAPAHQRLGSANAETTPAGAPAAAADRTQRPDATCEGKTG